MRTTLCIASNGSVACKCTHHSDTLNEIWMKRNKMSERCLENALPIWLQSNLLNAMWRIAHSPNTQGTLSLRAKAAKHHNSHKVTAEKLLSKCNNLILRAGRPLVQRSMSRGRRRSCHSFSGMDYGAHGFARVLQIVIWIYFCPFMMWRVSDCCLAV